MPWLGNILSHNIFKAKKNCRLSSSSLCLTQGVVSDGMLFISLDINPLSLTPPVVQGIIGRDHSIMMKKLVFLILTMTIVNGMLYICASNECI